MIEEAGGGHNEDKGKLGRRSFLKGALAGAAGGAVSVAAATKMRNRVASHDPNGGQEEQLHAVEYVQVTKLIHFQRDRAIAETLDENAAHVTLDKETGALSIRDNNGNPFRLLSQSSAQLEEVAGVYVGLDTSGTCLLFEYRYKDGTNLSIRVARRLSDARLSVSEEGSGFRGRFSFDIERDGASHPR